MANYVRKVPAFEVAPALQDDRKLDLNVIYTTVRATRATLEAAVQYARELDAHIVIVAAQVVPYPLPLEEPPVLLEFTENALWSMAAEQPVETMVEIYLCRDRRETLREILQPESPVMIAGKSRRWWPGSEQRLAEALRRDGHRVIFLNP